MLTDNEVKQELKKIHLSVGAIKHEEPYPGERALGEIQVVATELVNQIFSSAKNSYIVIKDDIIMYANQAFLRFLDVDEYSIVYNKNFYSFLANGERKHLVSNLRAMLLDDITIAIKMQDVHGNIKPTKFKAIYIEDSSSLTYILIEDR